MFDTAGYYDYLREQREAEYEIPDWAPRSSLWVNQHEEAVLTRVEKRIGRVLNYGEACKMIVPLRDEGKAPKRFIERARKCPDCGKWHTDQINRNGMCAECIPF
jgi:hypothetical protein